ncbi:MAG: PTS fructose transporter subunit IIA [Deltaproteobacteria bacterium]|nr:PTS fructose transporter subunit IIA [Deltaproteobacteria bacterium]
MIGCVIVSHGELGKALLATAKEIVGEVSSTVAISVPRSAGLDDIRARILDAVREVDCGYGVIVLADVFGGTAANVALGLVDEHPVEVITGMNLPMVLKLANVQRTSTDLFALAQLLKYYGQRNVIVASEALKERGP